MAPAKTPGNELKLRVPAVCRGTAWRWRLLRRRQHPWPDRLALHAAGLRPRAALAERADAGRHHHRHGLALCHLWPARLRPAAASGPHRQHARSPSCMQRLSPPRCFCPCGRATRDRACSRSATSTRSGASSPAPGRPLSSTCRGCRSTSSSSTCCIPSLGLLATAGAVLSVLLTLVAEGLGRAPRRGGRRNR